MFNAVDGGVSHDQFTIASNNINKSWRISM